MHIQKHIRFLLGLLYTALAIGAGFLLLPGLLPFLLGWGVSCLLEPAVRFISKKTRLRRSWVAVVILLLFLALFAAVGFFLVRRLWYELTLLSTQLPAWMDFLRGLSHRLDTLIYRWTVAVSPDIRSALQNILTRATVQMGTMVSSLGTTLLERCADVLLFLPRASLFLFTALLACFFFLAGRPTMTTFFRRQLPERWLHQLDRFTHRLKRALGSWLRTQGILMAVTFSLLAAGFLLMGAEPAILLAAGIALLDALPVLGTGTILLPWALFCVLTAELQRGISLVVLYIALWFTRSLLEPKLIANQAGLHPLAALFAMYLGFSLFGVAGMLLAPLGAILLRQLWDSGATNPLKD